MPTDYPGNVDGVKLPNPGALSSTLGHASLHYNVNDALIALQNKLGTGATTPAPNTVLRGTSNGVTGYGPVNLGTDVTGSLPVASLTGVLPPANGGTGLTTITALALLILPTIYPIGSVYTNADDGTNPATLLGFGTWTAFGAGRVPVGKASSGTFATAGSTLGEETHTLTISEMPSHDHGGSGGLLHTVGSGYTHLVGSSSWNFATMGGLTISYQGGGSAHNVIQPSVVVYMWKRTA